MPETKTRYQKWRMLNRDRYLMQSKARYQENKPERQAEALARYHRKKEVWKAASKRWKEKNKAKVAVYARRNSVRYRYGLSFEQYDSLMRLQGNSCRLCEVPATELKRNLDVDHCHRTGKVRSLLCSRCNRLIALAEKSGISILDKAKTYLEQHYASLVA